MKLVIVFALVAVALASAGSYYDSKYDNIDIKSFEDNERILKNYANCFIGDGPCTPEARELKEMIPDAVQSECAKCTEKQKGNVAKMIKAMQKKVPNEYETLYKQLDPEKKHTAELQEFVSKYSN